MPQAYHNFSFFILHFALIKTPLVLRKYKRRKFAGPLFFITLPLTEGHRGLPFAPGRTFIPLPHPGFQPPTQALYRFRWDYSFRSSRYETTVDCTTGYTGLSSHPMMEERKCSRSFAKRLPCPVRDGGKRSAVAEVNDSPVDCQSCDGGARRRLSAC